jgi:hypothetical protein
MNMFILTKGLYSKWHLYILNIKLDYNDLFDYLSNWAFSQIEQKLTTLV